MCSFDFLWHSYLSFRLGTQGLTSNSRLDQWSSSREVRHLFVVLIHSQMDGKFVQFPVQTFQDAFKLVQTYSQDILASGFVQDYAHRIARQVRDAPRSRYQAEPLQADILFFGQPYADGAGSWITDLQCLILATLGILEGARQFLGVSSRPGSINELLSQARTSGIHGMNPRRNDRLGSVAAI